MNCYEMNNFDSNNHVFGVNFSKFQVHWLQSLDSKSEFAGHKHLKSSDGFPFQSIFPVLSLDYPRSGPSQSCKNENGILT